jgi:succinate semialdehyde reductase (NADPH)
MAGLAELCVIAATGLFVVPDSLEFSAVATLGCSALTAYGAVRNVADIQPGDAVAVVAAGESGLR